MLKLPKICFQLIIALMVAKLIVLDAANSPETTTSSTRKFSKEEKEWWAIQPLRSPKAQTEGNPVDYFIQRKLEKQTKQHTINNAGKNPNVSIDISVQRVLLGVPNYYEILLKRDVSGRKMASKNAKSLC